MINKLRLIATGITALIFLSPLFLYWWGLANLSELPQPSKIKLTVEQELDIWKKEKEIGPPRVKKVTAYGYILSVYCNVKVGLYAQECMSQYPGLRISSLAIRNQVASQIHGKGNIVWQLTWVAYSIWVTRNWDIHQILATYHETYNTYTTPNKYINHRRKRGVSSPTPSS